MTGRDLDGDPENEDGDGVPRPSDADEPIAQLRAALDGSLYETALDRAWMQADLALLLCWRLDALLDAGELDPAVELGLERDRDEAIDLVAQAIQAADEAGCVAELVESERSTVLRVIGLLTDRADGDDLTAAIDHGERVLGVLGGDDLDLPQALYELAMAHSRRDDSTAGRDDRQRAIRHLRRLRDLIGDDHPCRAEVALRLGLALAGDVDDDLDVARNGDVSEAIAELSRAQCDVELLPLVRLQLGLLRARRYLTAGGDAEDRELAITQLGESMGLDQTIDDVCRLVVAQLHLAGMTPADMRRGDPAAVPPAGSTVDLAELAAAGELATRNLDELSDISAADGQLAGVVPALRAWAEVAKAAQDTSPDAMDRVIGHLDEVAQHHPEQAADQRTGFPLLRAAMLAERARRGDTAQGADHSVDLFTAATAQLDDDDPLRATAQDLLGELVASRALGPATGPGSPEEVTAALERVERAFTELPDGHPAREKAATRLAVALFTSSMPGHAALPYAGVRKLLTEATARGTADQTAGAVNQFLLLLLDGIQATVDGDADGIDLAAQRLRRTAELLPPRHVLRTLLRPLVVGLLVQRFGLTRDLDNLDAAIFYLDRPEPAQDGTVPDGVSLELARTAEGMELYMGVLARLGRNQHELGAEILDEMTGDLERAHRALPADSVIHPDVQRLLGVLRMFRSSTQPGRFDFPRTADKITELRAGAEAVVAAANAVPAGRIDHLVHRASAAFALVGAGFGVGDLEQLDRGIAMLGAACADTAPHGRERMTLLEAHGLSLRMRYERFRDPRDLGGAIERLEEACRLADDPDVSHSAGLFNVLADSYFMRGDRRRAVANGLRGLQERSIDVLLQSGAHRSLATALAAAGESAEVTRWCLAASDGVSTVRALELGRAMVLHAATVDASFPTLLREGGHHELADEWERANRAPDSPWDQASKADRLGSAAARLHGLATAQLPTGLRRRAIQAIEDTGAQARLLSTPPVPQITAALRRAGAAALVYLLPREHLQPGVAIAVDADGQVSHWPLPELAVEPGGAVDDYRLALRAASASPGSAEARLRWERALDRLGGWAWRVAMESVVQEFAGEPDRRVARLILVPVGGLGAVPWHAASREVGGGHVRHACRDAQISYAASARQFVEASERERLQTDSTAALIRVASSGLYWASEEVDEIRRAYYPRSAYLGGDGGLVGPDEVHALLPTHDRPGASLLHLCCHGVHDDPPVNSYLQLDGGAKLYVRDILRQARDRPRGAAGGLVVFAACGSDLTECAHDETLTLATAFLAAGGTGVIGARWPVPDLPTALFMVMFHHFLNSGHDDPPAALRATQLWMLDPHRTLPDAVGRDLAGPMSRADLAAPCNWAAFTYQGQ